MPMSLILEIAGIHLLLMLCWAQGESLEPSQDCFNKGIMAVKSSDVDSNFTLNGQMIP